MLFKKQGLKEKLLGIKTVKVCGFKCKIRKLNPIVDFGLDNMPQIFTGMVKLEKKPIQNEKVIISESKKSLAQLMNIVEVGLLEFAGKKILKRTDKEDGLKVSDIVYNEDLFYKLYAEIMIHSLNKFKGLKSLFFSLKARRLFYTGFQKNTADFQATSHLSEMN